MTPSSTVITGSLTRAISSRSRADMYPLSSGQASRGDTRAAGAMIHRPRFRCRRIVLGDGGNLASMTDRDYAEAARAREHLARERHARATAHASAAKCRAQNATDPEMARAHQAEA